MVFLASPDSVFNSKVWLLLFSREGTQQEKGEDKMTLSFLKILSQVMTQVSYLLVSFSEMPISGP